MSSPAFQFYPNEWLGSATTACMSPAHEGAYIRLLCYDWNSDGIPDDDASLASMSRLFEGWFNGGSTVLRKCFNQHPTKPGYLTNTRLQREREKQKLWREKSAAGGKKSGDARRAAAKNLTKQDATKGGSRVVEAKGNSSSSSSLSKAKAFSPPNPQPKAAGGEQASHEAELPKHELWTRVCAVVGRDPAKAKSHLEMCALSEASGITENDMQIVERFTAAERKKPPQERKGKWLAHTLLAEFHAEVGKARMALNLRRSHPSRPDPRAGIDSTDFLAWLRHKYPRARADITLDTADADMIDEYARDRYPNRPPP